MTAAATPTPTSVGSDAVSTDLSDRASRLGWPAASVVIAAVVGLPILLLAASVLNPSTEVWAQQWDTRLPGQLIDTTILLTGVSVRYSATRAGWSSATPSTVSPSWRRFW